MRKLEDVVNDVIEEFCSQEALFTAWDVTRQVRKQITGNVYHSKVREIVHDAFTEGKGQFASSQSGGDWASSSVEVSTGRYAWASSSVEVSTGRYAQVYHLYDVWADDYDPNHWATRNVLTDKPNNSLTILPKQKQKHPNNVSTGVVTVPAPGVAQVTPNITASPVSSAPAPSATPKAAPTPAVNAKTIGPINRTTDKAGRISVPNNMVRQMGLETGDKVYVQVTSKGKMVVTTVPWAHKQLGKLTVDKDCNIRIGRSLTRKAGFTNRLSYAVRGESDHITITG